jgi:hypothetical protein
MGCGDVPLRLPDIALYVGCSKREEGVLRSTTKAVGGSGKHVQIADQRLD